MYVLLVYVAFTTISGRLFSVLGSFLLKVVKKVFFANSSYFCCHYDRFRMVFHIKPSQFTKTRTRNSTLANQARFSAFNERNKKRPEQKMKSDSTKQINANKRWFCADPIPPQWLAFRLFALHNALFQPKHFLRDSRRIRKQNPAVRLPSTTLLIVESI